MIYFLLMLSTLVFLLAAIVFGTHMVHTIKKNLALGLGFLCGFIYSAFAFAIQINGIIVCGAQRSMYSCVQYPDINQIPITRIGFNLISENLKLFMINILTFGFVFFLIYFFKRQKQK
jgi:hypothetical protein